MARLYTNFVSGTLTSTVTAGETTIASTGLSALPVVTAPDIAVIAIDPDGAGLGPEIVYVTAHTAAATSATVTRAEEGTTGLAHTSSTPWRHVVTDVDLERLDTIEADVTAAEADIVTNTADIATNTADVATNVTDIATNVTNIATNAAASGRVEVVVYTSSGTFVKAGYTWARNAKVTVTGGGGGGQGNIASTNNTGGNSGAAGGTAIDYLTLASMASSVTVTVGAGTAGTVGTGAASDAAASSFGATCVAGGGEGARTTNATNGGLGTAGDILLGGGHGSATGDTPGAGDREGHGAPGAASYWGGGGGGAAGRAADGTGKDGNAYGAGGGGGFRYTGNGTGGDGADGIVIVELYG